MQNRTEDTVATSFSLKMSNGEFQKFLVEILLTEIHMVDIFQASLFTHAFI